MSDHSSKHTTCPNCEAEVTLEYKCQDCGKPRPFGRDDDGSEDRRRGGA